MTTPSSDDAGKTEWFSADRPITARNADKLGRTRFAEALAAAINGWRGHDSLVIALYGHWGTGKSSVKNMAVEALREYRDKPIAIVEFNPWEFANRDELTDSFFDQVAVGLGKGGGKKRKKAAARWRRYAAYLKTSARLLGLTAKPIALVLAIIGVVVLGSSVIDLPRLYSGLIGGFLILVALFLWFSQIVEQIVSFLEIGLSVGAQGLEELKDELAKTLRDLDSPLLVIMDDLDRLTPSELQEAFQLVKANADFPNLVYLLLFEREVVEKGIETVLKVNGKDYLEKIVQVGFDMPSIDRTRLQKILFEGLDAVLQKEISAKKFDESRWGNLFLGAMQSYFTTLRRVNRFLSTLSFHVALFRSQDSFEVNSVDLIGIETLRVFEPAVYQALARNKEAFTRAREGLGAKDDTLRATISGVIQSAPEERRQGVLELVKQLFPPAEWALGGSNYGSDFKDRWYREQRVCSRECFDRYFSLAIPEGDLSQAQLDRILAKTNNRGQLQSELQSLADQGLLETAMERLEAYKQEIPTDHAVPFVTALFDIGEKLSEQSKGMFEISSAIHASRIVYWFLKKVANKETCKRVLAQALEATEGLSLPVHFISGQEQALTKEQSSDSQLVDKISVDELKDALRTKIEKAASDGLLRTNPHLQMILFRWRDWGGLEQAKSFCEKLAGTQDGALTLLRGFMLRSWSHGMGDYVTRERCYITLAHIEMFVSLERINESIARIDESSLSPEDRRTLAVFREAIDRRKEGKPDFGTSPSED